VYDFEDKALISKTKKLFNAQRRALKNQPRTDAAGNQIEFKLTFEEWLDIWLESGHLHERGCKAGQYCMSRYDDIGHYEVGNVFIQLHADNTRQAGRNPKSIPDPVFTCEHCGITCNSSKYTQYHGANCNHNPNQIKVTCPHCNKTGGKNQIKQFHFDRCIRNSKHEGRRSQKRVLFKGKIYDSLANAKHHNNISRHLILQHPDFKYIE
jgi:hypothetical protein